MKVLHTRIAGFNHHDGASSRLMTMKPTQRLLLKPDPDNPYDKNAVQVLALDGLMLGFVPRADAPGVTERLRDRDVLVRCYKTPRTFNSIVVEYHTGDPLS